MGYSTDFLWKWTVSGKSGVFVAYISETDMLPEIFKKMIPFGEAQTLMSSIWEFSPVAAWFCLFRSRPADFSDNVPRATSKQPNRECATQFGRVRFLTLPADLWHRWSRFPCQAETGLRLLRSIPRSNWNAAPYEKGRGSSFWKVPKSAARNRKREFRNQGFSLSGKFTSQTPGSPKRKCYCLFSTLSCTRTRDFDPLIGRTSIRDLLMSPSRAGWL